MAGTERTMMRIVIAVIDTTITTTIAVVENGMGATETTSRLREEAMTAADAGEMTITMTHRHHAGTIVIAERVIITWTGEEPIWMNSAVAGETMGVVGAVPTMKKAMATASCLPEKMVTIANQNPVVVVHVDDLAPHRILVQDPCPPALILRIVAVVPAAQVVHTAVGGLLAVVEAVRIRLPDRDRDLFHPRRDRIENAIVVMMIGGEVTAGVGVVAEMEKAVIR
mmetsp:Transcript_7625/g.17261  ORF Transcript_7625/g.17261 Transcript_7625/m.17261 type:complete len:225 (+) Transcript_7625:914-1588(+)